MNIDAIANEETNKVWSFVEAYSGDELEITKYLGGSKYQLKIMDTNQPKHQLKL